jgi:hypothetical protein
MGSVGDELTRLESAVTEQLSALRAQAVEELTRLQMAVVAQRRSMAQLMTPAPNPGQAGELSPNAELPQNGDDS